VTDSLSFAALPAVLDDDEVPFVLGFAPDPRPAVEIGGARYRRGPTSYQVEWPVGELWLRTFGGMVGAGRAGIMASAGPILAEWWPLLTDAGPDPARPYLSAGLTRQVVEVPVVGEPSSIPVRVVPSGPDQPQTTALANCDGTLADEVTLLVLHVASIPVARVALHLLVEYRELVGAVPDVDVATSGGSVPLADLLEVAEQLATALTPQR